MGVLSACLPTMRPLLMRILPKNLQLGSTNAISGGRSGSRTHSRITSQDKSLEGNSSEIDLTGSMRLREYTTFELSRPQRAFCRTAIKGGFDVDTQNLHPEGHSGIRVQRGFSTDPSGIWFPDLDDKKYCG